MEDYNLPEFLPDFLNGSTTLGEYAKWLKSKASAHVQRDRKRGNESVTPGEYRKAIHQAVLDSMGKDEYTQETLDWSLLGQYNNEESHAGKRGYKAKFALLPSVDHIDDGLGAPKFKICAWRTNDAKNDLSLKDFVELCKKVVKANPSL